MPKTCYFLRVPHSSPEIKIGRQYHGVVLVPKEIHRYKPSWKAILAYYALAYYANNQRRCIENTTMRSLARIAAVSEDTMMRALEELKKKGLITIRHRSKKSASGKRIPIANLYDFVDLEKDGDPI